MQRILLKAFKTIATLCLLVFLTTGCANAFLPALAPSPWQSVQLPTQSTLLDVSFTETDPNHGWVVGTDATLMETLDGGTTWAPKALALGEQKYRFSSIDFSGDEGWVAGQPALLLHTKDAGQSWEQIPLSEKLPGAPQTIIATGVQEAEMTTDVGAIYRTTDAGRNWKALVNDAFGVVRSLDRSVDGKYLAVSARGNFFSIWSPGTEEWQPYNRNSSRRLQNMGFAPDGRLWMIARGGQLQFTATQDPEDWLKPRLPESSNSWGFLDMAFRNNQEIWAIGGSGTLIGSYDNGETWQRDADAESLPANLSRIRFFGQDRGYIIGQRGILLRYAA
jgi:photosystem II stability/assembly factor-like uncharacterized protein